MSVMESGNQTFAADQVSAALIINYDIDENEEDIEYIANFCVESDTDVDEQTIRPCR